MQIDDGFTQLPTIAAASVVAPPSGFLTLFFDSSNSNRLSQKNSSGNVVDLTAKLNTNLGLSMAVNTKQQQG